MEFIEKCTERGNEITERISQIYKDTSNLFKEIVSEYKEIEFDEEDDVRVYIGDLLNCSGDDYNISRIEMTSDGSIAIVSDDDDIFWEEEIDTRGILYLIDCIIDKKKNG